MARYVPLHRKGNTVVSIDGRRVPRPVESPAVGFESAAPVEVKLYETVIVRLQGGILTLDTGGYNTVTTRARMNQFLRDYMDGEFGVRLDRGQLYLVPKGFMNVGIPFERTITVDTRPDM